MARSKSSKSKSSSKSSKSSKRVSQVALKPTVTLGMSTSDVETQSYETRYYKSRPFLVKISPENVKVYIQDCDKNGVCISREEASSWEYEKIFIGDLSGNSPGNTILLKLKSGEYVFIGNDHIYGFRTFPGDDIVYYVSTNTVNNVPYSYGIGKTHTYFMNDKQSLLNRVLDLKTDAYPQFYYKKEFANLKKPFKILWQKVQGSLLDYSNCATNCKKATDKKTKRYQFKTADSSQSSDEPQIFETHYNNDRPYLVKVYSDLIEVYRQECDLENDRVCTTRNKVFVSPYKEIFYGDNDLSPPNTPKKGDSYGNSILIRLKSGEYVYIGDRMYAFKVFPNDKIQYYSSQIGDYDIPYAVAVGKNHTYFMLHKQAIPNKSLNLQMNPYSQFFFNKELRSSKKVFKIVWDFTKDSVEDYNSCLTRCTKPKSKSKSKSK